MASFVRFSALAAFVSAVSGYAIGEMPTQTVGYGLPFMQQPTEAPSMELMKRSLGKRALTNTCTEWTIPGGFGQPECSNSETCLFTTATDGYFYEGCGETSIAYDWITECWPYPQIGTAPVSQIYCGADAPSCGFLAFQFDELNTYYNFGCSTVSYSLYVDLVSTTDAGSSETLVLAAGGTSSITATAAVTVTDTVEGSATSTSEPVVIPGGFGHGTATTEASIVVSTATQTGSSGSTNLPTIGSHKTKKKAPIGGIIGGVVGGLAVIAVTAILLWFLLRRRRQNGAATQAHDAQAQQQQAGAATATALHNNNNNRISEIGGTMKPVPEHAGAFAPQQQQAVYGNGDEKLMGQQVSEYPSPTAQSPPPMYAQPPPQTQSPQQFQHVQQFQQVSTSPYSQSNYTELDNQTMQPAQGHMSVSPVSPIGTYNSNATELGGSNVGTYQPPASPQNMQQQPYQPPPNAQMYQAPSNVAEMSGNAASMTVRQSGGFDMSGAPMSDNFGHHELP